MTTRFHTSSFFRWQRPRNDEVPQRWAAYRLQANPKAQLKTGLAIPYNPYEPEPYQRWTLAGLYDMPEELLVADEFWDFLGGKGAYGDLLNVFEQVGIKLRPEIDQRFAKFK